MKHFDTARDIAEGLGLAPELFSGALRVTVWGRRQVMVEQHRGLLGYSGELIEEGWSAASKEEMQEFLETVKPYVKSVALRGVR